jgi:DNA-binding MarR family transcriptional regulator
MHFPPLLEAPYRSIYTYIKRARAEGQGVTGMGAMTSTAITSTTNPAACNCLALRQAARHLTQFYDKQLTGTGVRATQYSILSRLDRRGPMTINALAAELVMDRTTLGRNIRPLQRDGLIAIGAGKADRRAKELRLTPDGTARLQAARKGWNEAQRRFERSFGPKRAQTLRALLEQVTANDPDAVVG